MHENQEGEKRYEQVFGDTFAMYNSEEMEEFVEFFKVRFERNGLDPQELFAGKRCFDAGCGNGRGTIFMLMNGAEHVTSFDFSQTNVTSTEKFVRDFGFTNFETMQGTLEEVPFEEETFDFVWCNGVIMHTASPNKCLAEIARILKVGGQSWIYIYGSGGVYWRIIYHIRSLLEHVHVHDCMAALKLFRYETRYVAEFIDDWFSTHLRTYTKHDLSCRLEELGFESPEPLRFGTDYDTSHRLNSFASEEERQLMGEGDLRYLLTKADGAVKHDHLILEGEYGSSYEWPTLITERIDPVFDRINAFVRDDWVRVALAAHIQRDLRVMLYRDEPFDLDEILVMIEDLIAMVEGVGELRT